MISFGGISGNRAKLNLALGSIAISAPLSVKFEVEAAITKHDKFHLLIPDDIAYVTKDQAETSVLFELISARYERRSLLITANQSFGECSKIFPDQAMTLAAIDRLAHHATILEINVESYRRKTALENKRAAARQSPRATAKLTS